MWAMAATVTSAWVGWNRSVRICRCPTAGPPHRPPIHTAPGPVCRRSCGRRSGLWSWLARSFRRSQWQRHRQLQPLLLHHHHHHRNRNRCWCWAVSRRRKTNTTRCTPATALDDNGYSFYCSCFLYLRFLILIIILIFLGISISVLHCLAYYGIALFDDYECIAALRMDNTATEVIYR